MKKLIMLVMLVLPLVANAEKRVLLVPNAIVCMDKKSALSDKINLYTHVNVCADLSTAKVAELVSDEGNALQIIFRNSVVWVRRVDVDRFLGE